MQMQELLDVTTTILYKEGLEKGLEEKLLVFIANMLFAGFPLKQIVDLTGADMEKVKMVKEKLDTKEWLHPDSWTEEEWKIYFNEQYQ